MKLKERLRSLIKAGRRRGALWVRLLDVVKLLPSASGRGQLWTRLAHSGEVHQTTPDTADERYPELFDLAAALAPGAHRILSFGCSTGEELVSLRRRFPDAEIVGVEINPRSRKIAERRVRGDSRASVSGRIPDGPFDIVFALAVLQREPHKIAETKVDDLSRHYAFAKFDLAVRSFAERLGRGGLLCVQHAHYRVEDCSAATELEPIAASPALAGILFGADGRRAPGASGRTMFRKR